MSLKQKTVKGLFWVALEKVGLHLIQFVVLIFLARLLSPEDFGLLGMVMIFYSLSSVILENILNQAILREKEILQKDLNTAFSFNILCGFLLFILIFSISPLVSAFYEDERLTVLLRILSFAVLFKAIGMVFRILLMHDLKFKKQLILVLPANLISGVTAVALAFNDFGFITLAIKVVILEFLMMLFLIIFKKRKVQLQFDSSSFKRLSNFGFNLTASKIITSMRADSFNVLIGKFFSASSLGLFTQAQKLTRLFSTNVVQSIQVVTYPALAKIQDNDSKLKSAYRNIIILNSLVIVPLMAISIVVADPLIPFVLGTKWAGAVPIFQILCIGGMFYNNTLIYQNLLKIKNKMRVYLRLELIQVLFLTVALIVGLFFSLETLVILMVTARLINTLIYINYTGTLINYSFKNQITDIGDIFLTSIFSLFITYGVKMLLVDYPISSIQLTIILTFVMLIFFILLGLLFHRQKFILIKSIIKKTP
ncbi:MAG: lipopolysaccharide biosynthesis protein [Brumimicrobium sp.]